MFAVLVHFRVKPDSYDAFLPLMVENAQTSLRDEAGCTQFDVLTDPDRPGEVALYELYDTPEAFQLHLATPHFQKFDAAVAPMLSDKQVTTWRSVQQ